MKNFLNRYKPEAWLFGKGPSLELAKSLVIPNQDICISINESCYFMPVVDYIFAHDPLTFPFIFDFPHGRFMIDDRFPYLVTEAIKDRTHIYHKEQTDINDIDNVIKY